MKKVLFNLLVCFLSLNAVAQWNQLPPVQTPYQWGMYCNATYKPNSFIFPVANGVIMYDIYCYLSPSSGGKYNIMESTNDLGADTSFYSQSGMGCCFSRSIFSYNGSITAFVIDNFGSPSLFYTTNNFSGITPLNSYIVFDGGPIAVTSHYVYSASESSISSNDTLYTSRTNILTNTYQVFKTTGDTEAGKMLFINDSTGFLLRLHKSTNSNVLFKTVDYGKTWNKLLYDTLHSITDYCFSGQDTGYIINDYDSVLKTTNGGLSWAKLSLPLGSYTCIQFENGDTGYVGGTGGSLIKTVNGGASWTTETSNTSNTINHIYTFGNSLAYFVDSKFNIYKNHPLLGINELNAVTSEATVYPNPNNGKFTIQSPLNAPGQVATIYNVLGQPVYKTELPQATNTLYSTTLSVPQFKNGIYFYLIVANDGSLVVKGKIIIY